MLIRRWLAPTCFALLVAGVGAGLWLTRPKPAPPVQADPVPVPGKAGAKPGAAPRKERLVDESPLQTARRLMPLATSPGERQLSLQAERLANHAVDLAFTDALRRAQEEPPPTATPELLKLLKAKEAAEVAMDEDNRTLLNLMQKRSSAAPRNQDALDDQIDVARAELELDQDELDQANEALERVGGDPQGRIQRLKAAHNAVEPPASAPPIRPALEPAASLLARLKYLKEDTTKLKTLRQARKESQEKAQKMTERRVVFAQRVEKETAERANTKNQAAGFAQAGAAAGESSKDVAATALKSLQALMSDQRRLANFGRRLQDQQELTETYDNWLALVQTQQRATLHACLKWVLTILAVVFGVILAGGLFERGFRRLLGRMRTGRTPKLIKFAIQALGAMVVVFLVFGLPSQLTTVFGLAGAGLTVALKDVIMAFFGWFILVGRNGIHVGDWVEIQGVGGEVVEIGLLRTRIMETGGWNDTSHPTGRVVSFANSFAMGGHFFNFSTEGQWLWDELRVLVPNGQDPYPFIDSIRTLVDKATASNAELAQKEWARATRKGHSQSVSALPGVNVVPTSLGFEIRVRYITRAYERNGTQRSLNQALLELMLGKRKEATAPAGLPE